MRVPAISFDPPVGAPAGVSPLTAAMAAGRTSVSPDGRAPRRERWKSVEAEQDVEASQPPEPVEPAGQGPHRQPHQRSLPAGYPPLAAQRSVLDRPVLDRPAPERRGRAAARTGPAQAPRAGESVLEQHLRRVMGSAPRDERTSPF